MEWPRFITKFRDKRIQKQKLFDRINAIDQNLQQSLKMQYRLLWNQGTRLPFSDVEFRGFSQNGEDGILLYIFSLIGTTNKRAVEACAATGIECCVANLVVNHGWHALLMDGNEHKLKKGRAFYAKNDNTRHFPPLLKQAWITAENVNDLIRENGFSGEIDLLSLDLDGNDYWIWKSLNCISPRVIVLEYNDLIPADKTISIPYDPTFSAEHKPHGPIYCGASLNAFIKLGKEKGYRYVGSQGYGFNAFFIRNDVGLKEFPEVTPADVNQFPRALERQTKKFPFIRDLPWVDV